MTTPPPTATTPCPMPRTLWAIITGDIEHDTRQEYQRPFITGSVASDQYGKGEWDYSQPVYYGLGNANTNLTDKIYWDRDRWYLHKGDEGDESTWTGIRGQWSFTATPWKTDWSGVFYRKDISRTYSAAAQDPYSPIGIYTGRNPAFTGPPDYDDSRANTGVNAISAMEVMQCDDCDIPTGFVVCTDTVNPGHDGHSCIKPFLPPFGDYDPDKLYYSFCGGNVWPYEFLMENDHAEGNSVYMKYVGSGDFDNPQPFHPHDWAGFPEICQQVPSAFSSDPDSENAFKNEKCNIYFPSIWKGYTYDSEGEREWEITLSTDPGTDAETAGEVCTGNVFNSALNDFYPRGVFMGQDKIMTGGGWSLHTFNSNEDINDSVRFCCPTTVDDQQDDNYGWSMAIDSADSNLRSYAPAMICCPNNMEFQTVYPPATWTVDMPQTAIPPGCPNATNNYSQIKGQNIPFNLEGFGIACNCCRPCTPEVNTKFNDDGEPELEYVDGTCVGGFGGDGKDRAVTTTPFATTTTLHPSLTTTLDPSITTTTSDPSITTTTSAPVTTTPDPDQYICLTTSSSPFAGTYEKASWQYAGKPQWSKVVGSTTYWVYFHPTDGWSVTDDPTLPNIWKSPGELDAERPWDVSSFSSNPAGISLSVAQGACS